MHQVSPKSSSGLVLEALPAKEKFVYRIEAKDGPARAGYIQYRGFHLDTPCFMPVATRGSVKAIPSSLLWQLGYKLLLGNAYHLSLRPGDELIAKMGGLAKFMSWPGLVLTDSGGFQAFSLQALNRKTPDGFVFRNHLDGQIFRLSPERSIQIQTNLHADIKMCLDLCTPPQASYDQAAKDVDTTLLWAKRCWQTWQNLGEPGLLFAIVQGSTYEQLRKVSAQGLQEIAFPGYAIGGVSVGETQDQREKITKYTAQMLPEHKPRYIMGVGEPVHVLEAIGCGIDMFDCVLPTRNARNGCLLSWQGKLSIKTKRRRYDDKPISETCGCYTCQNYTRAYLRHLYLSKEILAAHLNSVHNLYFMSDLIKQARASIIAGNLKSFIQKKASSLRQVVE